MSEYTDMCSTSITLEVCLKALRLIQSTDGLGWELPSEVRGVVDSAVTHATTEGFGS